MSRFTRVYPKTRDYRTNSINALISAITGVAEIALGHIAILARTRNFCESYVPYTMYRFKWFVPCGRTISRLSSMGRIFTFSFLLVLMVTILLTIVVMHLLGITGRVNPGIIHSLSLD
ncbi:hypothetical protein C0J52_13527 [Blattella germanica]|nr:hypothetical protein C0J52_13527 [Blattella germanica]